MEIDTAIQLRFEQALKSLIPYLQSLADPDGYWDFLDIPFPSGFLFLAGHEKTQLPDTAVSYLGFIAGLPDYRAIGMRYPQLIIKMDLATAGIKDEATRAAAVIAHERRIAAVIRLFSQLYRGDTKNPGPLYQVLNSNSFAQRGLGFDAWNAEKPADGQTPAGTAFLASPSYLFTLHFTQEPDQWQPDS